MRESLMTGQTMTAETTTMTPGEPDQAAAPGQATAPGQAAAPSPEPPSAPEVTIQELLVEEVSIDGMCGVY
jgi:mycofactocin precursor